MKDRETEQIIDVPNTFIRDLGIFALACLPNEPFPEQRHNVDLLKEFLAQ